jgi:Uma2 family endonuclease
MSGAAGAFLVWVVDPHAGTITVCRRTGARVTLGSDDTLEAGDLLPGFTCAVRELFA